jgi:hypothetical protein
MRGFLASAIVLAAALGSLDIGVAAAQGTLPAGRIVSRRLWLLAQLPVRDELDLDARQIEELIRLEVERMTLSRGPRGPGEQLPTEVERRAGLAEYNRRLPELEKRGLDVLLPRQRERLDQILLQEAVRAFEPNGGVTHPQLAVQLGLADPQLTMVRQAAIAAEKEFNARKDELLAELNKAKEEARLKVLAELTPQQRATYDELVGKPYDFTQRD